MRLRTRLRSSSALWASPFAVALTLFYYFAVTYEPISQASYGHAPRLVSVPLLAMYPFAYALAAALGVWESGRLAQGAVWQLTPARSRYRVAAEALGPVIGLAWLMLVLPVTIALVQEHTLPTLPSLRPLVMAMLVSVAYAVIGFAVGRHVRPIIAAPVLAVVVDLLVATSATLDTFWWRHVLGRNPEGLAFGEVATYPAMLAQALPACGVALAVAVLWSPLRWMVLRVALGTALAVACALTAFFITRDWGPMPPVARGGVPMVCQGSAPQVCMPEFAEGSLAAVRSDVVDVLADLRTAGVGPSPSVVTDTMVDGFHPRPSTAETWRIALTKGESKGIVRYQTVRAAVTFPCRQPDAATTRLVVMWASERAGERKTLDNLLAKDPFYDVKQRTALHRKVAEVLAKSPAEQSQWYREQVNSACGSQT
ncbi:hypothetical protein J7E96_06870 [Streptomyces sp. ISL-96]|uniref:hypothetical protein n=1 Tax=Streptomyces sp. ISL-96 TaxID=2819191 RepID=UPI001BEACDA0|nr:hypothetical protein [Streptomyces sp. ISL-96]MBT2488248.1 hypothetical protein [Streptomyces sp. ISL-96]